MKTIYKSLMTIAFAGLCLASVEKLTMNINSAIGQR